MLLFNVINRFLALRKESVRLEEEAHAARLRIAELITAGKDDPQTRKEIQSLSHAASEADRAWQETQRKIDRHLGIRQ